MDKRGVERREVAQRLGLNALVVATLVPCALWDTDWLFALAAVLFAGQLFFDPTWNAATRTGQALLLGGYFAVYFAFLFAARDERYPLLMAALAFIFVWIVFTGTYHLQRRKLDASEAQDGL
jgi:hypothetical protein